MKIYSKKEVRDIILAFSLLGACLIAGYYTKQSPQQKTDNQSDISTQVLTHLTLLTKSLPAGR